MDNKLKKKVEKYVALAKKGKLTTKKNCEALLRFYNYGEARGLSAARQVIYFEKIKMACRFVGAKDFSKWDRQDMEKLFSEMTKKGYSQWTIETEKTVLKTFFKWFLDSEDTPKFLKWLKAETPPSKLTREELLTPEEIEKMILSEKNVMWKGLIAAFTSGARPGEIHNLRLGDVQDMGEMIKLYVGKEAGKMSKKLPPRPVYVLKRFSDFLRMWLKNHPQKGNAQAWLFVNDSREKIAYDDLRKVITRTGKKAGITKNLNPYLFRHTIGTYLYSEFGSVHARRVMGHSAGSRMEAVYCHLDESDVENVLNGKKEKQANGFDFNTIQDVEDIDPEVLRIISANKEEILKEVLKAVMKIVNRQKGQAVLAS